MEYRLLGSSGSAVSALALGTLTFGNEASEEDSFAQLDRFTEVGGSLIDTAHVYADGRSEAIIGRWLRARPGARDAVVIATKGRFPLTAGRTATACPASTSTRPCTRHCGGCGSTPSTCTSCTAGTR